VISGTCTVGGLVTGFGAAVAVLLGFVSVASGLKVFRTILRLKQFLNHVQVQLNLTILR